MQGFLVLENGRVFPGKLLGKRPPAVGEAVFNTSMNGYQEMITDPSYAGQILVLTYPQIGNYGFGDYGFEAKQPALQGLVVKDVSTVNGHYESKWGFSDFVERYQLTCLTGVDTRALTRALRTEGTMGALISESMEDLPALCAQAAAGKQLLENDLPRQVCVKSPEVHGAGDITVILWDFGSKHSIIQELVRRNCKVIVVPADYSAEEVLACQPDGIVLSNGPGDPQACTYAIDEIKKVIAEKPVFGICLGHQLAALAMGAGTYKLPFGHRGGNHTIKDMASGKCYVTSQNHGYAVQRDSLTGTGLEISFINLNDGTVEGLQHSCYPLMTAQFHPEAAPGPEDTSYLFDKFLDSLECRAV